MSLHNQQHVRRNFSLTKEADKRLKVAAKKARSNKSRLLSQIIIEKLSDPVERLKEEKKQLAIRMNEIDERVRMLQDKSDR